MSEILKEIVTYFLFVMLLLLVAYGNKDPNTYLLRKTLHETFVDLDQLSVDLADVSIYALLTKREVKMAGYWPSSFNAFLQMQKRTRAISSHLDRTSLVNKGFIILPKDCTKEFRFFGNKACDPERTR